MSKSRRMMLGITTPKKKHHHTEIVHTNRARIVN
jgi:hypothetical protein